MNNNSVRPAGPVIQFGNKTISGAPVLLILLLFISGILALVVYMRLSLSGWPMWVCAALWLAFIGYWGRAAENSAATKHRESAESRRWHELMLNGSFLLLFIPIPGLRQRLVPDRMIYILSGLLIQILFFGLAVWARRHLGRNWSGAISTKVDHELVRTGPYATIRHPIYTAMLGMFLGSAVTSGSLHALLALVLVAIAYTRKIPMEERHMKSVFGEEYEAYQRSSGALVPWVM